MPDQANPKNAHHCFRSRSGIESILASFVIQKNFQSSWIRLIVISLSAAEKRAKAVYENKSREQQVATRGVKLFRDFSSMFSTAFQPRLYTLCLCRRKVFDFGKTSVCTPNKNFVWWMSGKVFLFHPIPKSHFKTLELFNLFQSLPLSLSSFE